MHFEGSHTLAIQREQLWDILMDPEILARVTPGIKRLELIDGSRYQAISEIKMGPVNGAFKGSLEILDQKEPESFSLKIKMNSRIGNVSALGHINLKNLNQNGTEISFAGDAKLSGTLARTGQRVLTGVANSMTKQFFKALEAELAGPDSEGGKKGFFSRFRKKNNPDSDEAS